MTTFIALLRGNNAGGNTVISMNDLIKAFGRVGLTDVQTVLTSGGGSFAQTRDQRFNEGVGEKVRQENYHSELEHRASNRRNS
jgi:uncharacterized protein (DUF1697 family)